MNKDEKDPFLDGLVDATQPFVDSAEGSQDVAILVLGARLYDESDSISTFFAADGLHGVLAEGLYSELAAQIEGGDFVVFSLLREVIQDLQEDFEISPDEELDLDSGGPTLH